MITGRFIDVEDLDNKTYCDLLDETSPIEGLLVTEGLASAEMILDAFPRDGYMIGDAMELRDLILKFNAEHHLSPTIL